MSGPQYFREAAEEAAAYVESALLDATSSTSKAIPALGDTVTMTVGTGKEFTTGSIWKFAYTGDASNNFNLLVQSYTSGDVTGVCIVTNGSGTYASWSAAHLSAVTGEPGTTGYSSTNITVPSNNAIISFTTQTGKQFTGASLGYLVSLDGTKVIYGQFSGNYISGTGAWAIAPISAIGSGSSSSWKVVQSTPSLSYVLSGSTTPGLFLGAKNGSFYLYSDSSGNGISLLGSPGAASIYNLTFALGGSNRTLTFAGDSTISGINTGDAGPMTTRGDILYMNSSPAAARLAVGASGTVLKSDGTDISWGAPIGTVQALYQAVVTPTAGSPNASATDTTAETVTITGHGLSTGAALITVSNSPAGLSNGRAYYVNAVDANTISFHTTYADAIAGANKVNLTGAGAMTWRKLVYTSAQSLNMSTVAPVGFKPGSADITVEFNHDTTTRFSNSKQIALVDMSGLKGTTGNSDNIVTNALPSNSSYTTSWDRNNLITNDIDTVAGTSGYYLSGTLANQSTTAITVRYLVY